MEQSVSQEEGSERLSSCPLRTAGAGQMLPVAWTEG